MKIYQNLAALCVVFYMSFAFVVYIIQNKKLHIIVEILYIIFTNDYPPNSKEKQEQKQKAESAQNQPKDQLNNGNSLKVKSCQDYATVVAQVQNPEFLFSNPTNARNSEFSVERNVKIEVDMNLDNINEMRDQDFLYVDRYRKKGSCRTYKTEASEIAVCRVCGSQLYDKEVEQIEMN